MKVGILTVFNADNYGAVLQCYALQEFVKREGVEVEVVNYTSPSMDVHWSTFPFSQFSAANTIKEKIVILLKFFLFFTYRYDRKKKFATFLKNKILVSAEKYDGVNNTIGDKYDLLIIGSDQLWSKSIFKMDPIYWGNFDRPKDVRVVTYAVSCGSIKNYTEEDILYIKKSLSNFFKISVREDVLNQFISPFTNLNVETVLDPTLLLTCEHYSKLAKIPKDCPDKYILVYRIGESSFIDKLAKIASVYYGAKIVEVGNAMITNKLRHPEYIQKTPSVEEFLGYFKYATCVLSKSFHGLVFSLIFKKQFYVVESDIMDRVENLMSIVKLENRIVKLGEEDKLKFDKIDFDDIDRRISCCREYSSSYLRSVLQK